MKGRGETGEGKVAGGERCAHASHMLAGERGTFRGGLTEATSR